MKKNVHGITLIALVITIIVLLILAGVSISMLTGQNGILTQANNAKQANEQANVKEKVELAIAGAIANSTDGSLTINNLKEELSNYGIATDKTKFPVEIEFDGQKLVINNSGKVTNYKEMAKITGQETANTTTKDSLGNYIVVPAGFKIINPTENVTNGIVVEDVSHSATAGSQFVWIPVGDVIKDSAGNKENITLGRYVFKSDGTVDTELSKTEPMEQLKTGSNEILYFTEELKNSNTTNTHAKDIETFRTKSINNHGYYIGRYEARKNGTQITVKADDTVYNWITQPGAAIASRGMYNDSNFESDLTNSYAWDTAIVFLQKFDNRENKDSLTPYSKQTSLNIGNLASQGTNNLEDTSKQDKVCNVYDMSSNCNEWTTETLSYTGNPSTYRGGRYLDNNDFTSHRFSVNTSISVEHISFRPILYL